MHSTKQRGHSTKQRSAEDYLAELRRFIQLNGRAPRFTSKLIGTAEYKLRAKIQFQEKKGRFSIKEKMQLKALLQADRGRGDGSTAVCLRLCGDALSVKTKCQTSIQRLFFGHSQWAVPKHD